jgi:rhamnulokinase
MLHIAVDIGASSGRLVTGKMKNGKLKIEEIHRFANGFTNQKETCYWDIDHLLNEIVKGLATAKKSGYDQCTLGIDTWGTDYVLMDDHGQRVQEVISYRDKRTENTIEKVTSKLSKEIIYQKTGIQFLSFNTLYQLFEEDKEKLKVTKNVMTVPDYLGYCLTGKLATEVTSASAMQLLNLNTRKFDEDLLHLISLSKDQFPPFALPGERLGTLLKERFPKLDLPNTEVIIVASHDTASAIVGSPGQGDKWAYISSGTWSLLGIESDEPIANDLAYKNNYTNEWGAYGTFRFLKNIIGMWVIQEVRRNLKQDYNFEQFVIEAEKIKECRQFINFNEKRFLNPDNMIEEIQQYCLETNQEIPHTVSELANCIFTNLSIIYAISIRQIEEITGKKIEQLHIVGGGAKNEFVNQLTADVSGKIIYAGPSEATAIGNILVQMISENELTDLQMGRQLIQHSFDIKRYEPKEKKGSFMIEKFNQATSMNESNKWSEITYE